MRTIAFSVRTRCPIPIHLIIKIIQADIRVGHPFYAAMQTDAGKYAPVKADTISDVAGMDGKSDEIIRTVNRRRVVGGTVPRSRGIANQTARVCGRRRRAVPNTPVDYRPRLVRTPCLVSKKPKNIEILREGYGRFES